MVLIMAVEKVEQKELLMVVMMVAASDIKMGV
jgi:hypothetical protein